jgi:energy-coupling factor transporter ATP-binding protein EcfA2
VLLPVPVRGEIPFESVDFAYRPETKPEIQGLSLVLRPGEVVAMLGTTGAGKSTVAKLIARFYDPSAGRVTTIDLIGAIGRAVLTDPLPPRRTRLSPRGVKRAISKHRAKGTIDRTNHHATISITITPTLTTGPEP